MNVLPDLIPRFLVAFSRLVLFANDVSFLKKSLDVDAGRQLQFPQLRLIESADTVHLVQLQLQLGFQTGAGLLGVTTGLKDIGLEVLVIHKKLVELLLLLLLIWCWLNVIRRSQGVSRGQHSGHTTQYD